MGKRISAHCSANQTHRISLNLRFKPWCTANENIQQTNMITDIAGVDDVK